MSAELPPSNLNVILLHDQMVDKTGKLVTTSLTLIDLHDIARSCRTFNVNKFYIAHPSPHLRELAHTLKSHWNDGFGSTYNPNRKEALDHVQIVSSLDEAIGRIDLETGQLPKLISTSAKDGGERIKFEECRSMIRENSSPYLLMLGTGWGMCEELLSRADLFLEPIKGPGQYNHLSVRSALAILLSRLV
jgi:hypothetical protein